MFRRATIPFSQIIAIHGNNIINDHSGNNVYQQRRISQTTPQYKKQLDYMDVPDEIEEVDVTVKCTTRKANRPKLIDSRFVPLENGALVQMSFGDRESCNPKPVCKKFTLRCPQVQPKKRPIVKVCIGKKRRYCKLLALLAFLAALVAGYTYMTMSSREGGEDGKCYSGDEECECCTDKEATICCTFVEEPEK